MDNLQLIKSTINQLLPGSKVIIFGSRARHEENSDSDYDVLVVVDQTISPQDKLPLRTSIRKALLQYGIISDILVQSDEEIRKKQSLHGHIIRTILREGIPL